MYLSSCSIQSLSFLVFFETCNSCWLTNLHQSLIYRSQLLLYTLLKYLFVYLGSHLFSFKVWKKPQSYSNQIFALLCVSKDTALTKYSHWNMSLNCLKKTGSQVNHFFHMLASWTSQNIGKWIDSQSLKSHNLYLLSLFLGQPP